MHKVALVLSLQEFQDSKLKSQEEKGGRPVSALRSHHFYDFQSAWSHGKKFTTSLHIN